MGSINRRIRATLRLAVYRQSVRRALSPLKLTTRVFSTEPLRSKSLRKDGIVSYEYAWPLSSVLITHIEWY
jgi:hypothetical protein